MRAVLLNSNNKHHQNPHKQSLETKTIRLKSWLPALFTKRHAPAITLVVAGIFIASAFSILPAWADKNDETDINPSENNGSVKSSEYVQSPALHDTNEPARSNKNDDTNAGNSTSNSSTSINVESSIRSSQESDGQTQAEVKVDGREITPDSNGRIKEDYVDGDTDVRIRGRVHSNGSSNQSSISISSESSEEGL